MTTTDLNHAPANGLHRCACGCKYWVTIESDLPPYFIHVCFDCGDRWEAHPPCPHCKSTSGVYRLGRGALGCLDCYWDADDDAIVVSGLVAAAPEYGENAIVVLLSEPPERRFRAGETVTVTAG